MAHRPFASAPYVVGKGAQAPVEQHIPAEESLCPVISHDWVNSEYKHLVVDASPKALAVKPGQFFNLLCPSPDAGGLWLRRPQSVYRIDPQTRRVALLYQCVGRGTYGLATLEVGAAFYTCGSNRLLQLMKRVGKAHGIPGQVAMEQVMACGLGPCYVCVRTFEVDGKKELRRVCIEGPVFDLQEAVGW